MNRDDANFVTKSQLLMPVEPTDPNQPASPALPESPEMSKALKTAPKPKDALKKDPGAVSAETIKSNAETVKLKREDINNVLTEAEQALGREAPSKEQAADLSTGAETQIVSKELREKAKRLRDAQVAKSAQAEEEEAEVAAARQAAQAAYEAAGDVLPDQTPEEDAQKDAEETVQQAVKAEQARENLKSGVESPDFSKKQLTFALKQALDLRKAVAEVGGVEKLDLEQRSQLNNRLADLKIFFSGNLAQKNGDLLAQKLGLKGEFGPGSSVPQYQSESPKNVEELLKNRRVAILSEALPFMYMHYEQKPDTQEPLDQLEVRATGLLPQLQRAILEGAAQPQDFASELSAVKGGGDKQIKQLYEAQIARERLGAQDWAKYNEALAVLHDDELNINLNGELNSSRTSMEDMPKYGEKLRGFVGDYGVMEILKNEYEGEVNTWLTQLNQEQQEAVKKYIDAALDTYSGNLNEQETAELTRLLPGKSV
ncbi:MAG: hypothetical protein Q8P33_02775 [bacterium]|nr:hypothetical protein [bacterium]